MNKLTDNLLIKRVLSLDLPSNDCAVFGTGCMFAHGLKDLRDDIDLIARDSAWEKAKTLGKSSIPGSGVGEVVALDNGMVEVFNKWFPGDWNVDELIDTAEVIEGLRFVTLENVIKWKRLMARPKDFEHI